MESALRQRITPVRVLIAAQLAIIAVAGLATVFSLPRFTGDEAAHYSYVQSVAEEGRLPFLGTDLISPQAESIYEGVYPEPGKLDRRERGLGGYSYEGFQPPLTYLLAAPVFLAGGSDYVLKLRLLRVFGLGLLFFAAWLLWRLVRAACDPGEDPAPRFAVALTVFLWTGVVLRVVTFSNAGLEFVLGIALTLLLWFAWRDRSPGFLLLAALVFGLGLLTRLTIVTFLPGLLLVLWVLLRDPSIAGRTRALTALGVVAIPALMIAPWLASNLDRYGSLTASSIFREMQEPYLNPKGERWGLADIPSRLVVLTRAPLAEEWWSWFLPASRRLVAGIVGLAIAIGVPAGVLTLKPASRRNRLLGLLALPVFVGIAWMAVALQLSNWDFFVPRYLYPAIPGFAVLAAVALGRIREGRVLLPVAATLTVLLGGWWLYLAGVEPFTG